MGSVGTSVARKEGMDRATGAAKYADDLRFPGMLIGRTVRSTIARGRVTGVSLGFETAGFTVVDHRDIPGENTIALIEKDQPCLVDGVVRHAAEPILLLAHERREALVAANVRIEYEREEPLFDPARSQQVYRAGRMRAPSNRPAIGRVTPRADRSASDALRLVDAAVRRVSLRRVVDAAPARTSIDWVKSSSCIPLAEDSFRR